MDVNGKLINTYKVFPVGWTDEKKWKPDGWTSIGKVPDRRDLALIDCEGEDQNNPKGKYMEIGSGVYCKLKKKNLTEVGTRFNEICDCNGRKIDRCGVCGGSGCKDSEGKTKICGSISGELCGCNGEVIDDCGICGGDNTSCQDCEGTPNGDAKAINMPSWRWAKASNQSRCGTLTDTEICAQTFWGSRWESNWSTDKGGNLINTYKDQSREKLSEMECKKEDINGNKGEYIADNGIYCKLPKYDLTEIGTEFNQVCDCNGNKNDRCGICGGIGCSEDSINANYCGSKPGELCGCNGEVIDDCGVCNGDNTTCLDCEGTVNGNVEIDECGVCGGNNLTCTDCNGTINGSDVINDCGVCGDSDKKAIEHMPSWRWRKAGNQDGCGGNLKENEICANTTFGRTEDGVSKQIWRSNWTQDENGNLINPYGDLSKTRYTLANEECTKSNGIYHIDTNGSIFCTLNIQNKKIGITDGEACDCNGRKIDRCGVCGGSGCKNSNGETKICGSIFGELCGCNGEVIDGCGICDGDNSTCVDCEGTVNGGLEYDECNVCGGDNSSCNLFLSLPLTLNKTTSSDKQTYQLSPNENPIPPPLTVESTTVSNIFKNIK